MEKMAKKEKVLIRTYSAGVHYGTLIEKTLTHDGTHVVLENSRRIWKWAGAYSISDLATIGTVSPSECSFSIPVKKIELLAIEIVYMTDSAIKSFEEVPNWVFCKDDKKIEKALNELSKN
jgi:hypothetical protein